MAPRPRIALILLILIAAIVMAIFAWHDPLRPDALTSAARAATNSSGTRTTT